MRKGHVFLIAAPSGAGKGSLVKALLTRFPQLKLSISCTTRPPRPSEANGREYHFVDLPTFEQWRANGQLLEWAKVHDNYYGTPLPFIQEQVASGQDILLEIDWQGAQQVRKHFPDVIDIFILPPSRAELENRLRTRAQDSDDVIMRRLAAASTEIAHANEFQYVIINDQFDQALAQLSAIVQVADLRYVAQASAQSTIFSQFQ